MKTGKQKTHEQILKELNEVAPLAMPAYIAECEFCDQRDATQVLDAICKECATEGKTDSLLKPVALAVFDGLIEAIPGAKKMRQKGLTASRLWSECENFSYASESICMLTPNGYVEYKNATDGRASYMAETRPNYIRAKLENQGAMKKYKEQKFEEAGTKNAEDEYRGTKDLTLHRNNPDLRRNDPRHRYQAQPDHIVPLKTLHKQFGGNFALSDNDIRMIANQDGNLALTSAHLNESKGEIDNKTYVKKHKNELDAKTQKRMLALEKEATLAIENKANVIVGKNLLFGGTISSAEMKAIKKGMYDAALEQKRASSSAEDKSKVQLTEKEKAEVKKEIKKQQSRIERTLKVKKTGAIYGKAAGQAVGQAANMAMGNALMFVTKPVVYELMDWFENGLEEGVGARTGREALAIRFGRVKKYVFENLLPQLEENIRAFIRNFVSILIEGIVGLFVGVFKQLLKVIKEGIKVFVEAWKVLVGEKGKSMSAVEKGDAIIKIVGGAVLALLGVFLEGLMNRIGIPDPWSAVVSTILSGIGSAVFMYLLDRVDLFNTKSEKRQRRIQEVFKLRQEQLHDDGKFFTNAVARKLKSQREKFDKLCLSVEEALGNKDTSALADVMQKMAAYFKVALPYSDDKSFVDFVRSQEVIRINRATVC